MGALLLSMLSCNEAKEKTETETKMDEASAIINLSGYTPTLSSDAKIGDAKMAEDVLALFKTWDDGNLSAAKEYFADSITMYLRDGMKVSGSRDEVMNAMQGGRDNYTMMKNTIHVVFPVTLKPINENWVAIWSTEAFTDKSGKTDSVVLNETWRFNSNGKVDLMYQYGRPAASN